MRIAVFVLILAAAVAMTDNGQGTGSCARVVPPAGSSDFTINVLNTFQPGYVTNIRGLDFAEPNSILFISGAEFAIFMCSADDGAQQASFPLDPANGDPYGMADSYTYAHVNDYSDIVIYYYDGSGWGIHNNPYNENGRGMDFDGTYIWEAYGPYSASYGAACRFDLSGALVGAYNLPGISSQCSGLAVYPLTTDYIGLAVTTYFNHQIWFYSFTGSSMTLEGSAALPSCNMSLGLCYSESRGTFFWSYNYAGGYWISELQVLGMALEQSTWGGIKTVF